MLIESRHNPQFKELRSLLEPKGAKKAGKVLCSGRKIIPELIEGSLFAVCEEDHWPEDLKQPKKVTWLNRTLMKDLDIFGTHYPLLVRALPRIGTFEAGKPAGLEVVLCLQDPSNLGSVLRSAEAFGVSKAILLKECAFPFHPKSIRSSSGSSFRVQLVEGPSIKEYQDQSVIALDMEGSPINELEWPAGARIFIGEEGQGVPAKFSASRISIPINVTLDSLNAGVAASIAFFSYRQKHPL